MVEIRQNVPITEVWERNDWSYFDTYQAITDVSGLGRTGTATYPFGLDTQRHIDLRTFIGSSWTGGTLTTGHISSLNHWPGATATLASGLQTYTNVEASIDLTPLSDGYLTLALPNFPLSSVTLGASYLDLSSDGFSQAICALPWSSSMSSPTSGFTSLRWPYSALQGIDLTKVNGVRFRVQATGAATLYMMALRLVGPHW